MGGRHLKGLNPAQERAVLATQGPLLVLAGAGTGKTRVVTCRIAEIAGRGIHPKHICAVTFTNKAAREMRERVQALLSRRAAEGLVVSTFHSLGLRILREHGTRIGLPPNATIADDSDQTALLADALREAGVRRDLMNPRVARFRISLWKNDAVDPLAAAEAADDDLAHALALAYGRYEQELRRRGLIDFDDMILRTLELLEGHADVLASLQERWQYLLVDEYQDTNTCQYRLMRMLAGARRNLCVVGDDDQSIYGWRGAQPDRILHFTRDYHDAEVVTLDLNYRSTGPILDTANRLIAHNPGRREKVLKPLVGSGPPVLLFEADDEKDEMDFVGSQLQLLRVREHLEWEGAAVLFRANSQCRPLEQALRGRGIPYRVVGTRSFFDRREVRDLLAYLRLAVNPDDDQAFLRIANTPPRGLGRTSLDRLAGWAAEARLALRPALERHVDDLPARAAEGARGFLTLLGDLTRVDDDKGPSAALAHLVETTGYRHHLAQTVEDPLELKARLATVDDLLDTARETGAPSLAALLDALALREPEDRRGEENPGGGVTLMTLHAAKGLEFPAVILVGLEEGLLPHGNVLREEAENPASRGVEEERRLFYVGVTRARERLVLTRARTRRRFGRLEDRDPSRFLEEAGRKHFEVVDRASEEPTTPEAAKDWVRELRARLTGEA